MSNNYTVQLINRGTTINITFDVSSFTLYPNSYTSFESDEKFSMSYSQDGKSQSLVKELKGNITINFLSGKYLLMKMCRYDEKCGNPLCTYKHTKDLDLDALKLQVPLFTYNKSHTAPVVQTPVVQTPVVQTPIVQTVYVQQSSTPTIIQQTSNINVGLLLNYMEIKNLTKYCKDMNINIQGVTAKGAIIQKITSYYNI